MEGEKSNDLKIDFYITIYVIFYLLMRVIDFIFISISSIFSKIKKNLDSAFNRLF